MYMPPCSPNTGGRRRYSGRSCEGETVTGVTTMQMDEGLDTGDMIQKTEVPIAEDETGESLHDKLALAGARLCVETLKALENRHGSV